GLWGNEPGCKAWTAVAVLTPRRILQCWSEPELADRPPSTRRYENGWRRGSHFQPPPRSLRWQCNPAGLVRKPNSWPRPFRSRPHSASTLLPQTCLLQNAIQGAGRHIVRWLAGDGHSTGLSRVLVLAVAASRRHQKPAVRLDQLDHFPHLHAASPFRTR